MVRVLRIAVAVGLCVVTGCGVSKKGAKDVPQSKPIMVGQQLNLRSSSDVTLALLEPSDVNDMAALEGVFRVEGHCLYVTGTNGSGRRTTPAFAFSDISWNDSTRTLQIGNTRIGERKKVRLSGGSPPDVKKLKWLQKPDPTCDRSDIFVTGAVEELPDAG